ncbi:MAG: ABC transporter, partial [Micrococcales bacterium]|nr:ABC transporter [Micrococcales bacterium]
LVDAPRVLFLDEPTTGLDPQARAAMWAEIRRFAVDDEVTVLLTTHYLEEADRLADAVSIIDHGRVVADGTPAELKAQVARSSWDAEAPSPGADEDDDRDGTGKRTRADVSLEDVYLHYAGRAWDGQTIR